MQCAWRFSLDWVPGGEDELLDDEQHDYREWSLQIMRPWWELEHISLEQNPSLEYSRLLLPLPLLAPFTENSTATGNFPVGYFCATCGRVNVQRFLRHRVCESAMCKAKMDMTKEIGWVIGALSTRDRKVNSATISPDDKWAAPTTAEPAISFEDGTRLFHYHLAASPTLSDDSGAPIASGSRSIIDHSKSLSVRHIFNGNRAPLQAGASALFEALQRDVRIERGIGTTVFSTPLFESGDDPALPRNGRGVWDQQAEIIEAALRTYCCELGPLRVHSLRTHAWISDGKVGPVRRAGATVPCLDEPLMISQTLAAPHDILLARKVPRPALSRCRHLVALDVSISLQHQAKFEGEEREPPRDDGSWGYRGTQRQQV
jgi:hypothetical protein